MANLLHNFPLFTTEHLRFLSSKFSVISITSQSSISKPSSLKFTKQYAKFFIPTSNDSILTIYTYKNKILSNKFI